MIDFILFEQKVVLMLFGDFFGEVLRDILILMCQEVMFVKVELKEFVMKFVKGVGLMGVVGYGVLMVVFFLLVVLWWWFGILIGGGWVVVIVVVLWVIIVVILFVVGCGQFVQVEGVLQIVDIFKEIFEMLKRNEEN